MKIPQDLKTNFYLALLYAVFGLGYTLYAVEGDTGLFSQIALPFIFIFFQLVFSGLLIFAVFGSNRHKISNQVKGISLIILILPIVLALILMPLIRP